MSSQVTVSQVKRSRSRSRGPAKRKRSFNKSTFRLVPRIQRSVGFPATNIVQMKYATVGLSLVQTVGSVQVYAFSANSIYDPDRTGAGHQPSLHDTWATLYNHYTVIASKINVVVNTSSVTALIPTVWGVALNDTTAPASTTDYSVVIENGSKNKLLPAFSSVVQSINEAYNPKTFFSVVNPVDAMSRIGASFGSNPTEEAFFLVWMEAQTGVAGSTMYFQAIIDYTVALSEPKDFIQS